MKILFLAFLVFSACLFADEWDDDEDYSENPPGWNDAVDEVVKKNVGE